MSASSPLRFGVLGAAKIARLFVTAVSASSQAKVAAIGSRDAQKASAFAKEFGIERSHGSYEALLEDPQIDAVYIPLPNSLHAEWAIRALEKGKHVLCEKPIAVTSSDARAMFDAARSNRRHLAEAYPYLAQPQTIKVRELVASGAIGAVRMIKASMGFYLKDDSNVRFNPSLGAGATLDAGCYPISLVRILAGKQARRVIAYSEFEKDVDITTNIMLEFDGGLVTHVSCSFRTAFHREASIIGDAGVIHTPFLNHVAAEGGPAVQLERSRTSPAPGTSNPVEVVDTPGGNGFRLEAESFAALVAGNAKGWTGVTAEESIDIISILEAVSQSARNGGWVDVR